MRVNLPNLNVSTHVKKLCDLFIKIPMPTCYYADFVYNKCYSQLCKLNLYRPTVKYILD